MELVGFVGGAIGDNVIKHELDQLTRDDVAAEMTEESVGKATGDDVANDRLDAAEHLLLFMFTTWDMKHPIIKRAVARYSVGAKSTGSELTENRESDLCVASAVFFSQSGNK